MSNFSTNNQHEYSNPADQGASRPLSFNEYIMPNQASSNLSRQSMPAQDQYSMMASVQARQQVEYRVMNSQGTVPSRPVEVQYQVPHFGPNTPQHNPVGGSNGAILPPVSTLLSNNYVQSGHMAQAVWTVNDFKSRGVFLAIKLRRCMSPDEVKGVVLPYVFTIVCTMLNPATMEIKEVKAKFNPLETIGMQESQLQGLIVTFVRADSHQVQSIFIDYVLKGGFSGRYVSSVAQVMSLYGYSNPPPHTTVGYDELIGVQNPHASFTCQFG